MPAVAVTGPDALLERCAPSGPGFTRVSPEDLAGVSFDAVVAFGADATLSEKVAALGRPALLWLDGPGSGPPAVGPVRLVADDDRAWRRLPLPVADELFGPAARQTGVGWLGGDCERRREYMRWFGDGSPISETGETADVAVNLHDRPGVTFEQRALVALAQGRLLISETLSPSRGLEPGTDYLEARDLTDVFHAVENATRAPHAFRRVRLRGRRKAELFRASAVVARLAQDLLRELDAPAS